MTMRLAGSDGKSLPRFCVPLLLKRLYDRRGQKVLLEDMERIRY
jgi:hypothetical protein